MASPEAETSVLGAVLIANRALDEVRTVIAPGAFADHRHARIYAAMLRLGDASSPIDLTTLRDELRASKDLKRAGGVEYLVELVDATPAASNAVHYATIVRRMADLREVKRIALDLQHSATEAGADPQAVIPAAHDALLRLLGDKGNGVVPIADAVALLQADVDAVVREGRPLLIPTGIQGIDDVFGGLGPGKVTVVAARTSVGKSTLSHNIAVNIAQAGKRVAFFTLEMSASEIAANMQTMLGGPSARSLYSGRLHKTDLDAYKAAVYTLCPLPITIVDKDDLTAADVCALSRVIAGRDGLDVVFVDYLQIMMTTSRPTREREVAETTRALKNLSRAMGVHVVAVSQLNRSGADGVPRLEHMRESGAIEQDADNVILLHRPCRILTADERDERRRDGRPFEDNYAIAFMPKHRAGPTGDALLGWNPHTMRFTDGPPANVRRLFDEN